MDPVPEVRTCDPDVIELRGFLHRLVAEGPESQLQFLSVQWMFDAHFLEQSLICKIFKIGDKTQRY